MKKIFWILGLILWLVLGTYLCWSFLNGNATTLNTLAALALLLGAGFFGGGLAWSWFKDRLFQREIDVKNKQIEYQNLRSEYDA